MHSENTTFECVDRHLNITTHGKTESKAYEDSFENRGFYGEHKSFIEAINSGEAPRHSLTSALITSYLVELIEKGHKGKVEWTEAIGAITTPQERVHKALPRELKDESILVSNPNTVRMLLPKILEKYNIVYEQQLDSMSAEEMQKVLAIITGKGGQPVSENILAQLPNLKVVGIVGASVKKYNPEAILNRNISMVNAADAYAEAVAEFNLMQALVGIRNASKSHDAMRSGNWDMNEPGKVQNLMNWSSKMIMNKAVLKPVYFALRPIWRALLKQGKVQGPVTSSGGRGGKFNLKGATVGLIGYGAISKKFIELLTPFGCDIRVYSGYLTEEEAQELGVKKSSMAEILESQIISMHRGLSERTRGSFGRDEIMAMKPGTVFINAARAEIIDTAALLERLKIGDIFACLDVFDFEPLQKKHELRKLKNVFLTAHISGSTNQMYQTAASTLVNKVLDFLDEETSVPQAIDSAHLKNMT